METRSIEELRYQMFRDRAKPAVDLLTNMPNDPRNEVLIRVIKSNDRTKVSPKAVFEASARTNMSLETRLSNLGRTLKESGYDKNELDKEKTIDQINKLWDINTPRPDELSRGLIDAAISTHKRILKTEKKKKVIQLATGAVLTVASVIAGKAIVNGQRQDSNEFSKVDQTATSSTVTPTPEASTVTPINTATAEISVPTISPELQLKIDKQKHLNQEINELLKKHGLENTQYNGPIYVYQTEDVSKEVIDFIIQNNNLSSGQAEIHTPDELDKGATYVETTTINGNATVIIKDKSGWPDKSLEFFIENGKWICRSSSTSNAEFVQSNEISFEDDQLTIINGRYHVLIYFKNGTVYGILYGEPGSTGY